MTKQKAIKESIKHWERMIEWAKKQKLSDLLNGFEMQNDIGETWGTTDCPLCKNYFYPYDNPVACKKCPLKQKYGKCGDMQENYWREVYHSVTWKEWLINANKLLRQLKSLLN